MNTSQMRKPQKSHRIHNQRESRNTCNDWRKQLHYNQEKLRKKLQKEDSQDYDYFSQSAAKTSRCERRKDFRNYPLQTSSEFPKEFSACSIPLMVILPTLINHGVPASVIALLILSSLVVANATASNGSSYTVGYDQSSTESISSRPLNQSPVVTPSLDEMLDRRFAIDNSVNFNKLSKKNKEKLLSECEAVRDMIVQTGDKFPVADAAIRRVLSEEQIKVVCTTSNQIKGIDTLIGHGQSDAQFDCYNKAVYLSRDGFFRHGVIHHEFIHADLFLRHSKEPCLEKNLINALLPFYPASQENIKKYELALDKGVSRVREFKRLWNKEFNQKKLTQKETLKLKKYKDASKDCLPYQVKDTDTDLALLGRLGWNPDKKDFTLSYGEGFIMKILEVKKTSSDTIINIESVTPAFSIFMILDAEDEIIPRHYGHRSKIGQLAERHTYTFQHLSAEAARVFYPEATEIVADDERKCGAVEEASNFKTEF